MASSDSAPTDEGGGGLVPTLIAGAAILLGAGLFIFWPSGGDGGTGSNGDRAVSAGNGGPKGGVGSRSADPAKAVAPVDEAKRQSMTINASDSAEPLPPAKTTEEKIARAEQSLKLAQNNVKTFTKSLERLPKFKADAMEKADNPDSVESNYAVKEANIRRNLKRAEEDVLKYQEELDRLAAGG